MARITPAQNPSEKSQALLAEVKKKLGGTPNLFTTLAHSPAALGFYLAGGGAIGEAKLSASLREQLALAIAGANGCDYCASAHTTIGKMFKLEEAELARNLNAASSDAKVNAALVFARNVTLTRGRVSDAELAAVRNAGYSDGEILEIIAVVAINTFTNYVNHIAATEVDFPLVTTEAASKAA
ncbi:carboxymuconolactone decarboxylase family protein [Gimibacter soli]|uniref:Peroxidase-related enzyme n=1 Tax=Gimibacter soli TaxID=3024400 RepID=A0AAF0BGY4_9PROT|nr:peroxidase-related enzyme [Gimibacter soli]WCL53968.1 peroxidase-related enzyme [Gimibacter soli]